MLWNTIYLDAALDRLRVEGYDVRDEDVARLSPLSFEHINMLGRCAIPRSTTTAETDFLLRCYLGSERKEYLAL